MRDVFVLRYGQIDHILVQTRFRVCTKIWSNKKENVLFDHILVQTRKRVCTKIWSNKKEKSWKNPYLTIS